MLPHGHGDIIQVIEDAHVKGIDRACNGVERVSRECEGDCAALYLGDKSGGLGPDRLSLVCSIVRTDSSWSRDKVGACEARRRNEYQSKIYMRTNEPDSRRY
jgi:hypothetical protein